MRFIIIYINHTLMSITREQRFEIGTSINEKYRIYGNAAN